MSRVNHWNRLEPVSCDDPNPQDLSVSISCLFSLCLSLSLSTDLSGYNQHVACSYWWNKRLKLNVHWRYCMKYYCKVCCERCGMWSSNHKKGETVRWKGGQTGSIPMSVWSPGAAGVIGVARVGRFSVHSNTVQSQWLARGMRRDSWCGREGKLAAVIRRSNGLL